jgi:glucan phosphoethanolaminetransferase (alkaline phosphatase superfamily)
MNKIKKVILPAAIILLVAVLVAVAVLMWQKGDFSRSYSAVYLDTGDLYFGELSRFPYLSLSNVWYLQRDSQSQGNTLSEFAKAAWGPEDKIKINRDRVVWTAKISDVSQLIPYLNKSVKADSGQQNMGQPSGSLSQ